VAKRLSGNIVFQCECREKHKTYLKREKAFAIDCINRFDKKSKVYVYRLPRATEQRSEWIAVIHRNNWIQAKKEKGGFAIIILCQCAEFRVKSYPKYCIVIFYWQLIS